MRERKSLLPITQKDMDWMREMEEGAAYFSGQKSADAVMDILESRLSLYLSE